MTDELISLFKEEQKLMPFIHLPIQAGSDKILKMMNRKHTAEEYLQTIEKLKTARPDIAISGDFIVGFPDETDEDFEQTLKAVEKVRYAQAYSFKYSKRQGTPASVMENQVDEEIKTRRLDMLQEMLNHLQMEFNKNTVGKELDVLVERKGKYDGQVVGRSSYMQAVHMEGGDEYMDKLVKVKITEAFGNSLRGEFLSV
jgi:tRNA-2-methylthio-N6-dimethylallyladenosine synthase